MIITNQFTTKKTFINSYSLIGMPGAGKTTIGEMIAEKSKLIFFDTDKMIEKKTSKSISELFSYGEEHFRKIESEVLESIITEKNIIISTGGGIITVKKNLVLLKAHTIMIFINRPIESIIEEKELNLRPLLKGNCQKIHELYEERHLIYKNNCDIEIQNNTNRIEDCIEELCSLFKG